MNLDRAESTGFWIGVAAFAVAGAVLYCAHGYLASKLGGEWAGIIITIPAFCAVFVISPVQARYVAFARRQYCEKHGHLLKVITAKTGAGVVLCERCFMAMKGESNSVGETFGCNSCWPCDAEAAWTAKNSSAIKAFLIDDSHYVVSIWLCPSCAQHFLNVTTELIDWEAGEDPIYRTYMPITQSELDALMECSPPTEAILNALGSGRRCLKHDWPKDHPQSTYWSTGILVGPHD